MVTERQPTPIDEMVACSPCCFFSQWFVALTLLSPGEFVKCHTQNTVHKMMIQLHNDPTALGSNSIIIYVNVSPVFMMESTT
jgi:hypothetical protein